MARYRSLEMEDMKRMPIEQLKKEARRIFNTANKRAERLQKAEGVYFTPALTGMYETGGRFTQTGKNRNALLREIKRAQTFMEAETSSVKGAKKFYKDLKEGLQNAGVDTSKTSNWELSQMLEAYQKAKEENPAVGNMLWKYGVMSEAISIQEKGKAKTPQEIANLIIEKLKTSK